MNSENLMKLIDYSKNLRLLYVEDNSEVRMNTIDFLNIFFDHITVCTDGEEGLEAFIQQKFDLIITDINMVHMNGLEMIKIIKKTDDQIPVFILSAYNDADYLMESIDLDIDAYMQKPLTPEVFTAKLKKAIEVIKANKEHTALLNELNQLKNMADRSSIVSKHGCHKTVENMSNINRLIKQTKTLSLLYVEDDEETRTGTMETLAIFFDEITSAIDGQDALEKFSTENFDLIITDINMPKLNGIEMIKKIRDSNQNVPIIIVSAHDESSNFIKTIRFGIEAYLLKPFHMDDLIAVFHKVIKHISIQQELNDYKRSLEEKVKNQVEELNRQNSFMAHQARLASMGEMINNIAHQWRQPLNRINSCVAVLSSIPTYNTDESKIVASKINSIEQNTKYMSDTIEDFANFFHPDKEKSTFTLQDTVQKALVLIRSRTCKIHIHIHSDEKVWVSSFEKEYQQVILSILHNAIDNFKEKATKNPSINIIIKVNHNTPYLCIQDNGGGIDIEDINRIFEPYFTTKFSAEGTGLGLYMAKMLIESSMGGVLKVVNKDNGACFTIEIPKGEIDG